MKIVQVNKFYFPEYGTEKYLFGLSKELRRRGHRVIPFAMEHPKNQHSAYSKYFVSQVDLTKVSISWHGLKNFVRMIYSREARRKFAQLLDDTNPDVVHIHSIHHQISPSILSEAKKRNIPVVQTLHDYKLVTPSYLFPLRNGEVCTDCRHGKWMHVIKHRAHKESYLATAAVVLESIIHRVFRMYERNVDHFIAPSKDMADRLIEFGVEPEKLSVVPHFVDTETWRPAIGIGKGILFAGRLMPDRGLDHVLHVACAFPSEPIYIAGDGPDRMVLESKIRLMGLKNVFVLGRLQGKQLRDVFQSARLLFFPSLTLDTFGLTVIEAMASRRPVVATRLGGVNDLVEDGESGLLYDPQNPEEAVEHIKKILSDDALARDFGGRGRAIAEEYTLEKHYESIINVYRESQAEILRRELDRAYAPARLGFLERK